MIGKRCNSESLDLFLLNVQNFEQNIDMILVSFSSLGEKILYDILLDRLYMNSN